MNPLHESWARTTRHLADADSTLGTASHPGRDEYRDFVEHNELELALDALEAAGDELGASPAFWRALMSAADEMRLAEHSARYAARLGPNHLK